MITVVISVAFSIALLGVTVFPAYLLLGLLPLPHIPRTLLACVLGAGLFILIMRDFDVAQAVALLLICIWLMYLGRNKIAVENQGRDDPPSIFKS